MFVNIKATIDLWDPIGLLAIHCPTNEYDLESKMIVQRMSGVKNLDIEKLSAIIYELFDSNANPTASKILKFVRNLAKQYGFKVNF